jgi:hypothetical protein
MINVLKSYEEFRTCLEMIDMQKELFYSLKHFPHGCKCSPQPHPIHLRLTWPKTLVLLQDSEGPPGQSVPNFSQHKIFLRILHHHESEK